MIQVVIPTLCEGPEDVFAYTLEQLTLAESVSKIIIIDNTNGQFYKKYRSSINSKFYTVENKNNNFVNPSWNQGLDIVTSEHYMLLNDDICVYHQIFNTIDNILTTDKTIGLLTVKTLENLSLSDYITQIEPYNDNIEYTESMLNHQGIQGWIMAGRKKDWKPIPSEFKVWYGDNIIFSRCRKQNLKALNITSCFVNHIVSSTIQKPSSVVQDLIQQEIQIMEHNKDLYLG